ncbi:hypothetical protein FHS01_004498 [Longimicrobium terrae]|nr:LapA family protein [Longimicrobium terrae]MBB4638438.1 hypothetical protein [Longimicrobium terrae]
MPGWLPIAGVALAGALVTWLNRGERVVLHAGVATFYRAPLTLVLFVAFVAGMLTMMMLSLRQDMRMRQELRARGLLDDLPARPAAVPPRREPLAPAASRADDATWAAPPPVAHSPWADMDTPRRATDEDATIPHPREPDPPAY